MKNLLKTKRIVFMTTFKNIFELLFTSDSVTAKTYNYAIKFHKYLHKIFYV